MKTATVSEFRANIKEHLEDLEKDQDILVLSGPKKKDFVLITLAQYNSMEETAHLLSTPANTARLLESIAQSEQGLIAKTFKLDALQTGSDSPKAFAVKRRSLHITKQVGVRARPSKK